MRKLHIDFETRSRADLRKVGAWKYAADPSTEILCMAYSFGGTPTIEPPFFLKDANFGAALVGNDTILTAHNAHFEYAIYHKILVKRFGWPAIEDPARWDCTLARAAMCNLPISLDKCGAALGIEARKDLSGRAVMMKLSKPNKDGIFIEDPELHAKLFEYCRQDVAAEMEIDKRLPAMSPAEKEIWNLDLVINKRGVKMDVWLAKRAAKMAQELTIDLNLKLQRLTDGALDKASRVAEMKKYLATRGVHVVNLDKESVANLLADPNISPVVKEVLSIRRQVGKTSTSKYQAILDVAGVDERARGLMQYHGAGTGRWAGRLIQPHNFPKGVSKEMQEQIIDIVLDEDISALTARFGDKAMDMLSGMLRGTMTAEDDAREELIVADYSTIEPRVLFWLADDKDTLAAYEKGQDLYVELARVIFRKPEIVNSKEFAYERSVGKFGILGCGYGMGAPRFQAQCATAGLDISLSLATTAVGAYRDKYTKVVHLWREVEAAAKKAVREPGAVVSCCGGRVHWGMDKKREFLCCRLPNGKLLRYYKPSLKASDWGSELHYMGPGLGGALEDQKTYGGSLVENIVQAIAREILAAALLRLEIAGYDTFFHVHDEIVSRFRKFTSDSLIAFLMIMAEPVNWAPGLPLKADGWVGKRYRK